MNKLETTLIGMAQRHLSAVLDFYEKREAGVTCVEGEDDLDYLRDSGALTGLLELGQMTNSGMSVEARDAMREIEAKHAAAMRALNPITKAAGTIDLVPGRVPAEQFELLLAGTDIRGPKVLEALRQHLVEGSTPKEACEQTGANRGQFSLRLKGIVDENSRVVSLLRFYGKP